MNADQITFAYYDSTTEGTNAFVTLCSKCAENNRNAEMWDIENPTPVSEYEYERCWDCLREHCCNPANPSQCPCVSCREAEAELMWQEIENYEREYIETRKQVLYQDHP